MKRALKATLLLAWLLTLTSVALADSLPRQAVEKNLKQFMAVLKDPQYQSEAKKKAQKDRLWQLIREVFDFSAVSRRALGRNWRQFSPAQRKEFSQVFARMLGNIYIKRIQQGYRNDKVAFVSQEPLAANRALVKLKIIRTTSEVKMDYMLWRSPKGWKVYDVKVEGVSLVRNYRAQFKSILLNKPPSYLIERVKKKVAAQEKT